MMQHGILQTELDAYLPAMLADAEQLALSVDTQPHIDMCNLAIETLSNEQVLNSNVQSQQVRHVCYLSMRVSSKPSVRLLPVDEGVIQAQRSFATCQ